MPTTTIPADLIFAAQVDLQAKGDKQPTLEIMAYGGGLMKVNGFGPVVVDVAGVTADESFPLLLDHQNSVDAMAGTGTASLTGGKILVRGTLAAETDSGQKVLKFHRGGGKFKASIGLEVLSHEYIQEGATVKANGQTIVASQKGFYLIRSGRLHETSLVAIGADSSTSVTISAKAKSAMAKTAVVLDNENELEPVTPASIQATRQQAAEEAAEQDRIEYINARFNTPALKANRAEAIRDGWDRKRVDERVQLEGLRANRPHSPGIQVVNRDANAAIIEASLCKSAGCSEAFIGKTYGEQVTNEALSARHRGMGIQSLMGEIVRAAGMQMPSTRFGNDHIRTAFEASRTLQAGFSTINLPGILGNTANKVLREAWEAVKVVWPLITRKVDAKDFHAFKSYRLTLKGAMQELAPDGKIKHGSLVENSNENQVSTYALMLGLTRVDIINDNLNAFTQIPRSLGHLTQTNTEELVMGTLLGAGSFFSAGNKNLLTGTGNVLSITGLTNAETKFSKFVDANGKLLLLSPETLLTPSVLGVTAANLVAQTQIVGTSSTLVPGNNPHAGKFKNVSSPHLDADGPLGGGSDTAWYLFCNPTTCAALEVAFLNGVDMPMIEHSETDFDTLGMQWRTFYDVGCALGEPQGALQVTGAA